jgi:cell division protein FtsN
VIITDSKKPVPEKVDKKEVAIKNNSNNNSGEKWGLQVGIYSTKEAAENELKKFKQQRLLADILRKEVDGGTMYAVVIGDYSSRQSAEAGKTIVQQQCKCSPILYKK